MNQEDLYEALKTGQIWVSWYLLRYVEQTEICENGKSLLPVITDPR